MKNYLKTPLISLVVTGMLSMFTSCQTESINEEALSSDLSQTSALSVASEKSVALFSTRNATYISSENGGNVTCNREEVGAWETITMITWDDGKISFKGNNGKFLSDNNGSSNIKFDRDSAGSWERFNYDGSTITRDGLSGHLNGSNYDVSFSDGAYYDFEIIDLSTEIVSEKSIAIKASRGGSGYVSSENGGNVTCNRTAIGAWETFTMVTWSDGTVSFKGNNGLYLSDNHDYSHIKFDQEEAGKSEKFTIEGTVISSDWGDSGLAHLSFQNINSKELTFLLEYDGISIFDIIEL